MIKPGLSRSQKPSRVGRVTRKEGQPPKENSAEEDNDKPRSMPITKSTVFKIHMKFYLPLRSTSIDGVCYGSNFICTAGERLQATSCLLVQVEYIA